MPSLNYKTLITRKTVKKRALNIIVANENIKKYKHFEIQALFQPTEEH